MIQLTKGTNVLDINLSDFSGAGQDVVQNGSFTDISSDLVQNGDFAQIGSELVTNGDFSAAGSNLITNPNFTDTGSDVIVDGDFPPASTAWSLVNATLESGGARIDNGATTNNAYIIQALTNSPLGKHFVLTYDVIATNGELLAIEQLSEVVLDTATTGTNRKVYFTWDRADDNLIIKRKCCESVDITIDNVRLEELGEGWNVGTGWSIGEDKASVDAVGTVLLSQSSLSVTTGKSYKISLQVSNLVAGSELQIEFSAGNIVGNVTVDGVYTFYGEWGSSTILYLYSLGTSQYSVSNVTLQELGEGWTLGPDWSISNGKLNGINVTNTSPGTDTTQTGITFALKSFKVVYTISNYSQGEVNILLGGYKATPNRSSNGTFTEYITINTANTTLYVQGENSFTGSISNISIKEVGQDWTVGDGWTVEDDKAVFTGTSDAAIYQADVTTVNKYYKVSVEVLANEGTAANTILLGTNEINATHLDIGVHTFYGQAFGNTILYIFGRANEDFEITNITVQQLDTNNRWVTFADPDSKSVMKLSQVDLEIDSSGNNCGVYQTGLIKPNKLYIITINMKATAAINVEIAASLGTAVSAVIGTETLTTSYKEYSFEYVTPFAVEHDLQIHRLFGSGASQTISIDYVSMNGVDESQWTNDPTWNPFATSLVFVPTLTDESTNNSKQFTLNTSITDGGWDGRSLHGQVIINEFPTEVPASGIINLKQPDFLEGFYQVEIRGYLGTFYRVLGKCMAHLERASTEDGYNRFESYNDTVTYKAYEE